MEDKELRRGPWSTSEPDDDDGGGGGEHVPLLISSSSLGLSLGEEAAKNSPGTNRGG